MCTYLAHIINITFKAGEAHLLIRAVVIVRLPSRLSKAICHRESCHSSEMTCHFFLFMIQYIDAQFSIFLKNRVHLIFTVDVNHHGRWVISNRTYRCCCWLQHPHRHLLPRYWLRHLSLPLHPKSGWPVFPQTLFPLPPDFSSGRLHLK